MLRSCFWHSYYEMQLKEPLIHCQNIESALDEKGGAPVNLNLDEAVASPLGLALAGY